MRKLLCKLLGHRYEYIEHVHHLDGDIFIQFKRKRCGRYEGRWCKEN